MQNLVFDRIGWFGRRFGRIFGRIFGSGPVRSATEYSVVRPNLFSGPKSQFLNNNCQIFIKKFIKDTIEKLKLFWPWKHCKNMFAIFEFITIIWFHTLKLPVKLLNKGGKFKKVAGSAESFVLIGSAEYSVVRFGFQPNIRLFGRTSKCPVRSNTSWM